MVLVQKLGLGDFCPEEVPVGFGLPDEPKPIHWGKRRLVRRPSPTGYAEVGKRMHLQKQINFS